MKIKLTVIVLISLVALLGCRNYWHRSAAEAGLLRPSPGAELLSSEADKPQPSEIPDPAKKDDEHEHHGLERPTCPGGIQLMKMMHPDSGEPYVFMEEDDFDKMAKHMHELHVYAMKLEQLLGVTPPEAEPEPEPDEGPEPPKPSPKGKVY